jgi:hypothetical protein
VQVRLEFVTDGDDRTGDNALLYIVGTKTERETAFEFLGWVMDQRVGE